MPALLLGLAPVPRLPAQVGLGLAPMRLELQMGPDSQHSGSLTLTNDSSSRTRVRAEMLDFYVDSNETPQFQTQLPQESNFSCRQWISLNPIETELDPGAQILVRFTIRVPSAASRRGYHCAAGFSTMPIAAQVVGTGIRTAVRIISAFYITVGSPATEGELKSVALERAPSGWRAVVFMENYGDVYFRPSGELALLDREGRLLETARFNSIPVLPKREQRFLFPLKTTIREGKYALRARVDIGGLEIQEATTVVDALSPSP